MTSIDTSVKKVHRSASELAGEEIFKQMFLDSLVPYETAARLRRHFCIGHHYWTLIPPS
jgi:hypothetical protein